MRRLFVTLVVCAAAPAYAYPFLAPRPIGSAIAGPADPHLAAAFYNPAALGPLRGVHFWMDGAARFHEGSISRATVENMSRGSATINYTDFDAFLGLSWDLGTDTVTIALTSQVPYSDLSSFGDSAVRYQSIDQLFVTYQQSAALAVKISSRFFVGVAANFVESWMRWKFARDAAPFSGNSGIDQAGGLCGGETCGLENPLAREQIRLRGFGSGWGFSIGVLGRAADRLWLAASYTSHIFRYSGGDQVSLLDEKGARVIPPGPTCMDAAGKPVACQGNSSVSIYLPDLVQLAARVEVNPKVDLEATLRWIHYGGQSHLNLHTQGGTLGQIPSQLALPPSSRVDLGLQDNFGIEVSARFRVGEKLRLSPSLFFETSAVEPSAVSATALDAPKLDFALTLEWRPAKHLVLGAHLGGTAYFLAQVKSRDNSRDTANCVDAHYSLDACAAVDSGAGLPSASGNYSLFVVHLGGAVGFDY